MEWSSLSIVAGESGENIWQRQRLKRNNEREREREKEEEGDGGEREMGFTKFSMGFFKNIWRLQNDM